MPEKKYTFLRRLSDVPIIETERKKAEAKSAEAAEKHWRKKRERQQQLRESELEAAKKYARVIEDLETTLAADENIRQLASKIKNSRKPERILELNVGEAIATHTIKIGKPFKGTLQEVTTESRRVLETHVSHTPNVRMQNQITLVFTCKSDEQVVFYPDSALYAPVEDASSGSEDKRKDLFGLLSYEPWGTAFFPQKDSADKTQRIFVEGLYKLYSHTMKGLKIKRDLRKISG